MRDTLTLKDVRVFDETERPSEELFVSRNDPRDQRLGDVVQRKEHAYNSSDLVIIGCPQDEGVRRNHGRIGAAEAPAAIRRALYRLPASEMIQAISVFDMGDIRVDDLAVEGLESVHDRQFNVIRTLLQDGKRVIVLGGGNDISLPDCAAVSHVWNEVLAFNVDSHFDVRDDHFRTSGTPYRQLVENGYVEPSRLIQLASKSLVNSPVHQEYLAKNDIPMYSLNVLRSRGIQSVLRDILRSHSVPAIFWGIDADAVQTVDAPGVSASYPIGLTASDICTIARMAGQDIRTRVLEISEICPRYDVDGRTARLAGMILLYFLDEMASTIRESSVDRAEGGSTRNADHATRRERTTNRHQML